MLRKYFFIILSMIASGSFSQEIKFQTGVFGFFDNREYFNTYANDQTIFGTRAYAQAGFALDQKSEFYIGADGLYEFGSSFKTEFIKPILYFHYQDKHVNTFLGSFNRNKLINLPNVLLHDTIIYYRPNVEGIYLGYAGNNLSHDIWIDWISKQSLEDKEIFVIGGSGKLNISNFFYKHDFVFTHYALTASGDTNEHIRDNGGLYARIGLNLSEWTFFDSLSISSGITFSYDRLRNVYPLSYEEGSLSEVYLQYHKVGARLTSYFGSGQVIISGDPLYKADIYNRLDLFWKLFGNSGIEGIVEFSFHFIEDIIDYSQKFTIRADIGRTRKLNTNNN